MRRLVLVLLFCSSPALPAAGGGAFTGSKICAGCHAAIYRSYVQTPMGRSMSAPSAGLVAEPVTIHDPGLNRDYRVYRQGVDLVESESETRNGQLVFESAHPLAYVIGSGENGMSFAVRRGDHLFQAPLSYYSRAKRWDLSPGFQSIDQGFNRPIYEACIVCHAGRPNAVPDRDGLFRNPAFSELAIGCENCHGPGETHVKERAAARLAKGERPPHPDEPIVNPGRLPAALAQDICINCHQGGEARVLQPGKHYSGFLPGQPLLETVAIVSPPLVAAQTDLLGHDVSMRLSACYRNSGGKLNCVTCHNPHEVPDPNRAAAYYRAKCFTCHTGESCRLSAQARSRNGDNCIACHMPKRDVTVIAHSALTNHQIPRQPDGKPGDLSLPRSRFPGLPGLLLLNASQSAALPFPTKLAAYGELADRSADILNRYTELLGQAARLAPDDPGILAELGRQSLLEKRPEALDYLGRAAQSDTASAATLIEYSEALDQAGQIGDSAQSLQRAANLFPYAREIRKRLILHYIQLKKYSEAATALRQYVETFPEDDFMRELLERVGRGA